MTKTHFRIDSYIIHASLDTSSVPLNDETHRLV